MFDDTQEAQGMPETVTGANIVPRDLIGNMCRARDAALEKMDQAANTITAGFDLAREAEAGAKAAHNGVRFYHEKRTYEDHYKALFGKDWDREKSLDIYRKTLDASAWTYLLERAGVERMMDRQAKLELERSLMQDVPEFTVDNVDATLQSLFADADLIFKRGIANAFSNLDRRFRSHDGFKIGSRIILTNVFSSFGGWSYGSHHRDTFIDIERVFSVLDGDIPNPDLMFDRISQDRGSGMDPRRSVTETEYFTIKGFMNGNAHIWFRRDDLVEKVNQLLAEFYGEVIGDAMTRDATAEDLRNRPGLPAKDLQFYPTPEKVVSEVLHGAYTHDARILEPSAGTGAIVFAAAKREGAQVDAIEIHPERCATIARANLPNVNVTCANFLQVPPAPEYDSVLMNPPFSGTHWADHVMHAFEFLKPGGILKAVLPVTAAVSESKRHVEFRKWVKRMNDCGYWDRHTFQDLPLESFAESGTRISTCILTMRKRRS